jgi:hypothetical protein
MPDIENRLQELLFSPEKLSPELRPYLELDPDLGWAILRHPLVYCVPYFEGMNAIVNRQLTAKRAAIAEAEACESWERAIWLYERPFRLDAFEDYADEMTDGDYWRLLGAAWIDSENIRQNVDRWTALLQSERNGRGMIMKPDERKALTGKSPIFRVAGPHRGTDRRLVVDARQGRSDLVRQAL